MRIGGVTSTELFGGTAARPLAIVRLTLVNHGPGRARPRRPPAPPHPARAAAPGPGEQTEVEVGVEVATPYATGSPRQVTVIAEGTGPAGRRAAAFRVERAATITAAEPGWTMWMVSHFHYDPVWWSTQGQFTESRIFLPDADGSLPDSRTAFELVRLHLDEARRDPDYKFVLAEIDYLKPHFDAHPAH